jgi:hypothetical protein
VGHGGSVPGFLAGVFVDPEERSGAVTLANATSGLDGDLTVELMKVLRGLEPRVVDAWSPGPLPSGVELDLLGPWYQGPSALVLRAATDGILHLDALAGDDRVARFRALDDGRWVGLNGYFAGEVLTVGRDASGSVTHLDIGSFSFTRAPYEPAADVVSGTDEPSWH